jgi:hypothetical protein
MSKAIMANRGSWAGAPTTVFSQRATQPQQQPMRVTGLNKAEAEELLDWLEANGHRDYCLSYAAGNGFTVICTDCQEANR